MLVLTNHTVWKVGGQLAGGQLDDGQLGSDWTVRCVQLASNFQNIVCTFIYTKYNIHHEHHEQLLCILTLTELLYSKYSNTSKHFISIGTVIEEASF